MSRHTAETEKYTVCIGVDRPLSYVFAQVLLKDEPEDEETDEAPGFDSIMNNWSVADYGLNGVDIAVEKVEKYLHANESKGIKIPSEMVKALKEEVLIHLRDSKASLNFTEHYGKID